MAQPVAYRNLAENLQAFSQARLGLFIHYGLYSLLGRAELVLNREQIPMDEYRKLADDFTASAFDADAIARLAVEAGCRYICMTTEHVEGFALYDSQVNPFNSVNAPRCRRDLIAEMVQACRKHGLRIHLYHNLNNWTTSPDAVDALEDPAAQKKFVDFTHARIRELVTKFNPVDCIWYDGWWPFNAQGWRAKEMNEMVRSIQPHVLVNGRNGLAGDFATPEGHISVPKPWRAWESCITHNRHWGYHEGDPFYTPTFDVLRSLLQCAGGAGNLLINVGPMGDGSFPQPSINMLKELGSWMRHHSQAIYGSELMKFSAGYPSPEDRSDFTHFGPYTARGNILYSNLLYWPGDTLTLCGMQTKVKSVRLLYPDTPLSFTLSDQGRLVITGLPKERPHPLGGVVAIECDKPGSVYMTCGMRVPNVRHVRYDPVMSDTKEML